MRVLLSTIGSRGDVQPLVALGLELTAAGHEARLCVPPDFREWIEGVGLQVVPIGPAVRSTAKAPPRTSPPTPEQRRTMLEGTVAAQFETLGAAARNCDVIVGATALQIAAPSIAAHLGIPYVFAAYCPTVLPSPHHAPPVLRMLGDAPASPGADHRAAWERDAQRWNAQWRDVIAPHRQRLGLPAIEQVRGYVLTDRPWLAADPALAPWPDPDDPGVLQTGAWIVPDDRPLSAALQAFLDAGEPPVYFGFGSSRAPEELARAVLESARALSRRIIVSRGWADVSLVDGGSDCLVIGEVNQSALFGRVAAVVHHGGAGTTTGAARAGAPQVVIPQHYDQFYWGGRVAELQIGAAHALAVPTAASLTAALERALDPATAARARSLAPEVRTDGAAVAVRHLVDTLGAG